MGDCHGWARNDGTDGWLGGDGRGRGGCDDWGLGARLGDDAARRGRRGRLSRGVGGRVGLNGGGRGRRCGDDFGGGCGGRRRRGDNGGGAWRRGFGCCLGMFALEDGFERVAGFGDLREVKLRLVVGGRSGRGAALAAVFEVVPDPLGLVGFDGAGVGLSGHADCFERVQDWPALDFQFSCQIVDSNFAHPSLFGSLCA